MFVNVIAEKNSNPDPEWFKNAMAKIFGEDAVKSELQLEVKILVHAQNAQWYIHSKKVNADFFDTEIKKLFKSGVQMFDASFEIRDGKVIFDRVVPVS